MPMGGLIADLIPGFRDQVNSNGTGIFTFVVEQAAGGTVAVSGIKTGDIIVSATILPKISKATTAGAAAGAHTIGGVAFNVTDTLVSVWQQPAALGTANRSVSAGGAAGAHTITGGAFTAADTLLSVWEQDGTSGLLVDLTSEFTITGTNTIDNTAGTATTGDFLIVEVQATNPGAMVDLTSEFSISATNELNNAAGTVTTGDLLISEIRIAQQDITSSVTIPSDGNIATGIIVANSSLVVTWLRLVNP